MNNLSLLPFFVSQSETKKNYELRIMNGVFFTRQFIIYNF